MVILMDQCTMGASPPDGAGNRALIFEDPQGNKLVVPMEKDRFEEFAKFLQSQASGLVVAHSMPENPTNSPMSTNPHSPHVPGRAPTHER